MRRSDIESARRYFRSGTRIFNMNGSWYFATREGEKGPFFERQGAERTATRYANARLSLERIQGSRRRAKR